jgi:group II intron reverse transcriptase/maturase
MRRLPKSLSVENFQAAWRESRDSKSRSVAGAPGADAVRATTFASDLPSHIAEIRRDLADGRYRFSPLRIAPVQKKSGGYRIIAIPTVRDRLLQRVLLRALEADSRFRANSPIAYGFTKGRKLAEAQRRALELRNEHGWVLQADIIKFFDNIPRDHLKHLIRRRVRGKTITQLLCSVIDCELERVGGQAAELVKQSGIERGKGLRQGMPLSPMLSNLLLKNFDELLARRGLKALRYADDIAVFAKNRDELDGALHYIMTTLKKLELDIPELEEGGKTTIKGPSETVEFLGVEIRRMQSHYRLAAPHGKISLIEEEMGRIATITECKKQERNIGHLVRWLDSFIVGHRASMGVLDEDEQKSFLHRLEAAKGRKLNKLLVDLIGRRAVEGLDDDRRAILGLQRFNTC